MDTSRELSQLIASFLLCPGEFNFCQRFFSISMASQILCHWELATFLPPSTAPKEMLFSLPSRIDTPGQGTLRSPCGRCPTGEKLVEKGLVNYYNFL